jgi:hypothetical protein
VIRVAIDLCPYGDTTHPQRLGAVIIGNDGTGTHARGNYVSTLHDASGKETARCEIKKWPRLRHDVFALLVRSLIDCGVPHKKEKGEKHDDRR